MPTDKQAELDRISIAFGALCKPIKSQLPDGYAIPAATCKHLQKDADAITRLSVRGLLTDSERLRARKRLMNQIQEAI